MSKRCTRAVLLCFLLIESCSAGPRTYREERRQEAERARAEAETDEPFSVKASHVLVAYSGASRASSAITRSKAEARTRAEEVLARAKQGEDFAGLASELSDGPSSAKGGSLGVFKRDQMVQAFSDAAFSLEPGQLYDQIVETEFGFHVIRRDK